MKSWDVDGFPAVATADTWKMFYWTLREGCERSLGLYIPILDAGNADEEDCAV